MIPPLVTGTEFGRAVEPIAAAVDSLARHGYSSMSNSPGGTPPPSVTSQAMVEISEQSSFLGAWDSVPIDTALTHIALLLHAGEDAMKASAQLARSDDVALYAFQPVARFGLECFARAFWLCEPGVGTKERVRRSLNERLASAAELARLPAALDREPGRQERLLQATQLGFQKLSRKGKPPCFAPERPSITSLVKRVFDDDDLGQVVYGYLSAVSHGTIWGLAEVAHAPDDRTGPVVTATLVNSSNRLHLAGIALALAQARAVDTTVAHMGWSRPEWEAAKRAAAPTMKALVSKRGLS